MTHLKKTIIKKIQHTTSYHNIGGISVKIKEKTGELSKDFAKIPTLILF